MAFAASSSGSVTLRARGCDAQSARSRRTAWLAIATWSSSATTSAEDRAMSSGREVAVAARSSSNESRAVVRDSSRGERWPRVARVGVDLQQSSYTSPLPSPDDLDRYAAHIPHAGERLLAVGEREQAHRHQAENRLLAIDEREMPKFYAGQRVGQVMSLVLGLAYLGAMVLAMLLGYPLAGVGGSTFGIAAIIWAIRREPSGSDD